MSQSRPSSFAASPLKTETATVQQVLQALEDPDCREILEATSQQPLSATELVDVCDIAQSTAYRKLDMLSEAGLVTEQIRLSRTGKHTSEYVRSVNEITLSMDGEDGVTLDVQSREANHQSEPVFADAD